MLFRQYVDDDLGCASYLVGDEAAGVAVVVDPAFAIERYVAEAERAGVRLTHALETHTHADHVSGHGRLALEHGVAVAIHPAAEPAFPFTPLDDDTCVDVGAVTLRVLHTPGHRPEHCCFAVVDRSRADEPWLVLTGDSLFVGDAGRPDLAVDAREGAAGMFESLRRLLDLADGVEVYPGHVAGSLCGAAMSSKPSSTIGFERRFNPMLGFDLIDDFVAEATRGAGLRPPNVERIVTLNRGPFVPAPAPLERVEAPPDAVVLDVRPAEEFASGHVPGAINVPLSSSGFGTKAGFVLSPEERLAIHAPSQEAAELAARRLHAVGFLDLVGWFDAVETPARLEPIELPDLERLLARGDVEVIDVREPDERHGGYIAGSRHIPYRLLRSLGDGIAGDRTVVTICEGGPRAAIAASILAAKGVPVRPVLDGGMRTWRARGNETVSFRRCGS